MNEPPQPLKSIVPAPLTPEEQGAREQQIWTPGFGMEGQRALCGATVMVSRVGGLGGIVALELAAAGVGRLVLAHGGVVEPSDLNRQLLTTHDRLGHARIECIVERLSELNPRLEMIAVGENVTRDNASWLVEQADLVVDAALRWEERYAINDAAFEHDRPVIECTIDDLFASVTTMVPGLTPSLRELYPEPPAAQKCQMPLFGATTAVVGGIAAMEAIKVISGLGQPLTNRKIEIDLRSGTLSTVDLEVKT